MTGPWRDHCGHSCPTHPKASVRVQYRGGHYSAHEHEAHKLRWNRADSDFDIIRYQVTSVEDVE